MVGQSGGQPLGQSEKPCPSGVPRPHHCLILPGCAGPTTASSFRMPVPHRCLVLPDACAPPLPRPSRCPGPPAASSFQGARSLCDPCCRGAAAEMNSQAPHSQPEQQLIASCPFKLRMGSLWFHFVLPLKRSWAQSHKDQRGEGSSGPSHLHQGLLTRPEEHRIEWQAHRSISRFPGRPVQC